MAEFAVRTVREPSAGRLIPRGELDIATVPILEGEFHAVHRDPAIEMIAVDLRCVKFMDASGIHLLERMSALREARGGLRVISGSRAVDRIIDLTGVSDRLRLIVRGDGPFTSIGDR